MTVLVPGYESVFGRIVSGSDVEAAVMAVLQRWSGTYLSEVERQHGITVGTLARVKSWQVSPTFDKFEEDRLPAVIVVTTGLADSPVHEGDGRYSARWSVGVGCLCSARTMSDTHEQGELYAAAHRALLIQRPSLEGFAAGIEWPDESYDELPFSDWRSLGAAVVAFEVHVDDVVSSDHGPMTPDEPLDPDTLPWPPWQTATTHEETIVHVPAPAEIEREEEAK